MGDGRVKNGGARSGAGRKTKRDEDDLLRRLKTACKRGKEDLLDEVFRKLVEDATSTSQKTRSEARKLLLAYIYGRPVERQEVSGADGKDLFPTVNVIIESPTPSQAGSGPSESGD